MINKIVALETLDELENYLLKQNNTDDLRNNLLEQFTKYADYKNAEDWNKCVRICESLAIVGWGNHEPLEALKGIFFNGNPMTCFINKFGKPRFVDAIWSKRKNGITMEQGRTSFHSSPDDNSQRKTILSDYITKENIKDSKLQSQRNWIPKNPIWIQRGISNCYENSKEVIESINKELQVELNQKMQPEKYGRKVNRIILNCSFSYFDHYACKANYIISESDKKMTSKNAYIEIQKMFSKKEIEENGYFLRNRYEFGPYKKDTGNTKITIHFEKEFSELSHSEQRIKLYEYFSFAINKTVEKLKTKKLDYNFELMLTDFNEILSNWKNKKSDLY
ncbi:MULTISPECIES: hypothetical protein [Flavobacterium]|uniref:Uncharacterized protein n=1 Tax=Flavobacterium jumunjinense TaxID=998845 RepID=A0ABV5GK41_9FLAO|nr:MULTISPECIES: hypothetical protein [Flavobacterium]